MNKFCFSCGSSIESSAAFCNQCGVAQHGPQQPQAGAKRKDPGIAALLSFLIPGAGQIYADQPGRGIAIFLSVVGLGFGSVAVSALLGIPVLLIWMWGIYDAYDLASGWPSTAPSKPPPTPRQQAVYVTILVTVLLMAVIATVLVSIW